MADRGAVCWESRLYGSERGWSATLVRMKYCGTGGKSAGKQRKQTSSYSQGSLQPTRKDNLTIFFTYYNLIWIHSRLKKTAAWLAGLVDKAFTFRELFSLRCPEFICGH